MLSGFFSIHFFTSSTNNGDMHSSIKKHASVWLGLLALLFATWGFSRFDLGRFNIVVALSISLAKMLLIFAYFMELRADKKILWVIAGAGFLWLLIFFDLTLTDYFTRSYSWSQ
jgi:cytochrome c oxidase subunit 4